MASEYRAPDWQQYRMDWTGDPHPVMEDLHHEISAVDQALQALVDSAILPHGDYDHRKFLMHRQAVRDNFEIPWTGISPRMQRLLYAINAVLKPQIMVAIGIFCGNTFISNAGAAIGPGACYRAQRLVGLEIVPKEAARARRNVATVDGCAQAEILCQDGVEWLSSCDGAIDLLYIDADGAYLPIVEQADRHGLGHGSVVLAHNSVNFARSLAEYLRFVRDPLHSLESVNVYIDDQGLEVTLWR